MIRVKKYGASIVKNPKFIQKQIMAECGLTRWPHRPQAINRRMNAMNASIRTNEMCVFASLPVKYRFQRNPRLGFLNLR